MCFATIWIDHGDKTEKVMHDVAYIEVEQDRLVLATLLGEERFFKNKIKSIDLLKSSVVLEEGNKKENGK